MSTSKRRSPAKKPTVKIVQPEVPLSTSEPILVQQTDALPPMDGPIQVTDPGPVLAPDGRPIEEALRDALTIEEGDHVYIGEAADDKVHWEVDHLPTVARNNPDYPAVRLISGMTGRMRLAALASLTLHSKGSASSGQA